MRGSVSSQLSCCVVMPFAVVEVVSLLKDVFVSSTNAVAHGVDCVGRATIFMPMSRFGSSF